MPVHSFFTPSNRCPIVENRFPLEVKKCTIEKNRAMPMMLNTVFFFKRFTSKRMICGPAHWIP